MPTEIKVILPEMGMDDSISTITDTDHGEKNFNDPASLQTTNRSVENDDNDATSTTTYQTATDSNKHAGTGINLRSSGTVRYFTEHNEILSPSSSVINRRTNNRYLLLNGYQNVDRKSRDENRPVSQGSSSSRVVLQQTQHRLLDIDFEPGQGPSPLILERDRSNQQNSPNTVTSTGDETPVTTKAAVARGDASMTSKAVRPALTDTYDVDLEHRDMMMKALQSYGHYQNRGDMKRRFSKSGTPLWDDKLSHLAQSANGQHFRDVLSTDGHSQASSEPANSEETTATFKLAQCQLRYYDDHEEDKRRRKKGFTRRKKSSPKSTSSESNNPHKARSVKLATDCVLYPREKMDGILVDSVGHVYRTCRPSRPRSALPCKFSDFVKLSGREFAWDRIEETSTLPETVSKRTSENKRPISGIASRNPRLSESARSRPSTAGSIKVLNLRLDGAAFPPRTMAGQPIPHSVAYDRRNRTTHAWGDSNSLSQSMPNSNFLHRQYGTRSLSSSTASSPRYSRGEPTSYSERTSPAGKPSDPSKPSASYSYDGGFFVGAHSGKAEYFVIHPDWVSEVMTIKKLSVNPSREGPKNKRAPPLSQSAVFRPRSLQGRRCLSAPPQKRRNPITWVDSNFLADASNFDACGEVKANSNSAATNGDVVK